MKPMSKNGSSTGTAPKKACRRPRWLGPYLSPLQSDAACARHVPSRSARAAWPSPTARFSGLARMKAEALKQRITRLN